MTIEKVVQYWYTTSRSVLLKYKGSDGYLYVGKGRVERTYFFYLFLAFRDRYMQVKVSIKWQLKVHGNVQIGTKRDTFAQVNRLTSEFESCIVHQKQTVTLKGWPFCFCMSGRSRTCDLHLSPRLRGRISTACGRAAACKHKFEPCIGVGDHFARLEKSGRKVRPLFSHLCSVSLSFPIEAASPGFDWETGELFAG